MAKSLFVLEKVLSDALCYQEEPVLAYGARYPQLAACAQTMTLEEINARYKEQALDLVRILRTEEFAKAVADRAARRADLAPFHPYEFLQAFEVPYSESCIVSLYIDLYGYTGGAHGGTHRRADTWDTLRGERIPLSALFPADTDYAARITGAVLSRIREQPDPYFSNASELVTETFDAQNYYLTPDALAVFFGQYDIAPYAAGIPTFLIPYAEVGAAIPRCSLRNQ